MPEVRKIGDAIDALDQEFAKIGTEKKPTTVIPAGTKNSSPAAAEFFAAKRLKELADDRFKVAQADAHVTGILGNPDEYRQGVTMVTWTSGTFDITVTKARDGGQLDKDKLLEELEKAVGTRRAADIIVNSQKKRNGAVTIKTAIKGDG